MQTTHSFNLLWTPWSLTISVLAILAVAVLGYVSWQRSGFRRAHGLLELSRLALVITAAFLLNQPEYREQFQSTEKPTIALIADRSPSMTTSDVDDSSGSYASREQALDSLISAPTWTELEEQYEIVHHDFGRDPARTDIHRALVDTKQEHSRLAAAVLVSDGDWNEGTAPVEAATSWRLGKVPLFTIPVGSPTRLPDVELVSLDAPTFGVAGKTVRVPFTIESALPRETTAEVTLRAEDGTEVQKQLTLNPMGRTNDAIIWEPTDIGDTTLTLEVKQHPDETQADNNRLTAPISIREEKLRVLLVESYPRWEYRYLRNALSRDPGVELSCLLFHPGLSKVGGGNRDYITAFPGSLDQLSEFDVVFLGDVGLEEGQLTEEDCRLLKGLVQHQASGLVFMPGWQGRQLSLLETDLSELYPVVLDETQPGGWGSRTPSHFELTQVGQRSLLTKLADSEEDNLSVWSSLPGFQWYAAVSHARPGCEVLAVHRDMVSAAGRIPLLVTRTFGSGKVLFMGTDGAWRWRKGVEDLYHYRFWGQVVRWMAYQRNMAEGERMRLYYTPDQPKLHRTLALSANVMSATGEPIQKGTVTARIRAPSGKLDTVRFQSSGDEWGAFSGQFTPNEPGQHQLTLSCREANTSLEAGFFVQGVVEERPGRPARWDVMQELASVTRGQVLTAADAEQIVDTLRALPEPPPRIRRVQLWAHPVTGGLFVALLGAFWIGRKAVGLI